MSKTLYGEVQEDVFGTTHLPVAKIPSRMLAFFFGPAP